MATDCILQFKNKQTWPQTLRPKLLSLWAGGPFSWQHAGLPSIHSTHAHSSAQPGNRVYPLSASRPVTHLSGLTINPTPYPVPSMTKLPPLLLPGPSSFFLFLTLVQNPMRHYLLYVGTSSKTVTARLPLLMGRSKGDMRFLNAVTMETEGSVTLMIVTPEIYTTYQLNSAFYPKEAAASRFSVDLCYMGSCSFSSAASLLHCLTLPGTRLLSIHGICHKAIGHRTKEQVRRFMKPPTASSFSWQLQLKLWLPVPTIALWMWHLISFELWCPHLKERHCHVAQWY